MLLLDQNNNYAMFSVHFLMFMLLKYHYILVKCNNANTECCTHRQPDSSQGSKLTF